jgi:hypothetical protein
MAVAQDQLPDLSEKIEKNEAWLTPLARAGYTARGVVYLIIGGLAVMTAFGEADAEGSSGAIAELLEAPFGKVLIVLIGVGLIGYALWRAIQSIFDTDAHGTDAKGLAVRIGLGVSAVTHTLLAIWTFSLLNNAGSADQSTGGSGNSSGGGWAETVMSWPAGWVLVILIGLCIIGAGIAHVVKGFKAGFMKHFKPGFAKWPLAKPLCQAGLIAKGIVFGIIGGFLVYAGISGREEQARGLAGALETVRDQPYGTWLLLLLALGLVAFGLYSILEAIYRRVNMADANLSRTGPTSMADVA